MRGEGACAWSVKRRRGSPSRVGSVWGDGGGCRRGVALLDIDLW